MYFQQPFRLMSNGRGIKIDWHDYETIQEDLSRVGLGEQGKPANLTNISEIDKKKLYDVNGFNAALSDKISLNRSLPDIRHPG